MMKNLLIIVCLLFPLSSALPADDANFGKKDPGLLNLKGSIYFLPAETYEMPADIETQKPQGVIYAEKLDIPVRDFSEGFPGVTDRFEWFGLIYTGVFEISKAGVYKWRIESDDGSRLWVDGKEIINNDGGHPMQSGEAEQELSQGRHAIKVWYFQGPATEVGLQLFITVPGAESEKIFSLADFSAGVSGAFKNVNAKATKEGIRIQLDAQVLFDTNKYDLKPAAAQTIKDLVQIIATYPGCLVRVEGHTDNVGSDEANQALSENRARSVMEALKKAGVPAGVRFEAVGFGKSQPAADNNSEKGRALNRRVEMLIVQ
ncbi:MAG: OmpA family protein [Candidatus Aminicenantes bacterium]|nr:OmpA family protein [Candidatus Aminicenantes bacterium]